MRWGGQLDKAKNNIKNQNQNHLHTKQEGGGGVVGGKKKKWVRDE